MSTEQENIGNAEPVCPYCSYQLPKMPVRKSKCPQCKNYFYVRTGPIDRCRVIVTSNQAAYLDELGGPFDIPEQYYAKKEIFEDERAALRARFGCEPSVNDVRWSLRNKELIEHSESRNWGLYRNTISYMAEILEKESKYEGALKLYLETCYLDLNGPQSLGALEDDRYLSFNPRRSLGLAPGIVLRARKLITKLGFNVERTRKFYLGFAEADHEGLRLPITPDKAWEKIENEIFQRVPH